MHQNATRVNPLNSYGYEWRVCRQEIPRHVHRVDSGNRAILGGSQSQRVRGAAAKIPVAAKPSSSSMQIS